MHRSEVSSAFTARYCPDRDGAAVVEGETHLSEGSYTSTMTVKASGQVGDDAHLKSIEVRANNEATSKGRSDEVSYRRDLSVGRQGKTVTDASASILSNELGGSIENFKSRVQMALIVESLLDGLLTKAEGLWRSGECLEIRTDDVQDRNKVKASSTTQFLAELWHRFDGEQLDEKIAVSFDGDENVDPHSGSERAPVRYNYLAGEKDGDKGTVTLESGSRRGIVRRDISFTVGGGWTMDVPAPPDGLFSWHGERCDTSEIAGEWLMTATGNVDGVVIQIEIAIRADSSGGGTYSEHGWFEDEDVRVDGTSGGTVTWEKLSDDSVRFSLQPTQPIEATATGDGDSQTLTYFFRGAIPNVPWKAGGCSK